MEKSNNQQIISLMVNQDQDLHSIHAIIRYDIENGQEFLEEDIDRIAILSEN